MFKIQRECFDTHPRYVFHSEYEYDDEAESPVGVYRGCVAAWLDGELLENPNPVRAAILAENILKNEALKAIISSLPQSMKKEVLDTDGDPTGEWVIKDKHQPTWEFGEPDGIITFSIPGASLEELELAQEAVLEFNGAVQVA